MTEAVLSGEVDSAATARRHALLRFSTGVTTGFVLAETMGWLPTFLVPLLVAVLLANLPASPPFKVGILLVGTMTAAAVLALVLTSLFAGAPVVLVGCLGLIVFGALYTMAKGQAVLPMTLLLLCVATIPVVGLEAPAHANLLPIAMARGMAVAVPIVWLMFALWPQVTPPTAKPTAVAGAPPLRLALTGTAIVMPLLLAYMTLGLTNALPVLVTTVLLVATFDVTQGAAQGGVMVLGNLFGGFVGFAAFALIGIAPSLVVLALITLLIATVAAEFVTRGGAAGALALLTCNSALIIFSIAMANPDSSSGIWITRLLQFCLAWVFAVGMLWAVMPRTSRQ